MKTQTFFTQRGLLLLFLFYSLTLYAQITPRNALTSYIHNDDTSYQWEIHDSIQLDQVKAYHLKLTSQTWRNSVWIHELTIFVPKILKQKEALLFITGGYIYGDSIQYTSWDNQYVPFLSHIAEANQAITAVVRQVPRQPLFGDLEEDALISYTFHQYQKDKDYTWPLLFPMVKSATRSMDAIQEFANDHLQKRVKSFVVSGASKRGWTTWLTAAIGDKRIIAIAPMVIDILNMPVSVAYQQEMYGGYSIMIQDYVSLGLTETVNRPDGQELVEMVDPYSYRTMYKMPKMIILATNDEYWTADAVKNYVGEIPGKNYIYYVPNEGHKMGNKSLPFITLDAFFANTIQGKKYPKCDYTYTEKDGKIILNIKTTSTLLEEVIVWEAESDSKDFRKARFQSRNLNIAHKKRVQAIIDYPKEGKYKAFHISLKYKQPSGDFFYQGTRVFVTDANNVFPIKK